MVVADRQMAFSTNQIQQCQDDAMVRRSQTSLGFMRQGVRFVWKQRRVHGLTTNEACEVLLPGDNYPYWLAHTGEGHSVYFTVPEDCSMKGMAFCIVYLSNPEIMATECLTSILIANYTKRTLQIHRQATVISFNDEDWQEIISHLGGGDNVEISVASGHHLVVKKTAVYLMYGESNDIEIEPPQCESDDVEIEPRPCEPNGLESYNVLV
ncbi:hypothetical protein ACSQ67_020675 [Phaseolus vulgaris]